jgi:hypothetical protein
VRAPALGLEVLGIASDDVLNHAMPRLFYACELDPDARLRLMGLKKGSPPRAPSLAAIAEGWRRRWLLARIRRPDMLAALAVSGPGVVHNELVKAEPEEVPDQLVLDV